MDTTQRAIKYMDYNLLKQLNENSVKAKRNRNFWLDKLPINKDQLYTVASAISHNDREMRLRLTLNEQGDQGYLDISFAEYDALPAFDPMGYEEERT